MDSFTEEYFVGTCICKKDLIVLKRLSKFESWWKKVWVLVLVFIYLPLFIIIPFLGIIILGIAILSTEQIIQCQSCKNTDLTIQNIVERYI